MKTFLETQFETQKSPALKTFARPAQLLILALMLAILSGCAAPIIVAGAAGGAVAVSQDQRSPTAILDDQVIETKVNDGIHSDSTLEDKIHINVTSYNGIVLLTGETLSRAMRARVLEIAKSEPRVRQVYNEVRVADLTDIQSRSNDTWITSKVKTEMLTAKDFKSNQVKVVTEFGTVYLMGLVTKEMGNQGADIARNISGVKRVVKLFEYQ